ncbi:hypothetical protein [Microscilla marina]|uniref:Uncharacterized protein n=1 Tax=Microscilla marina ATCC 23134 TaxID=313606 RepID=A2A0Q0_MICM2|nr:hypothetical protein [Microscilla marina]EAY23791.1 hypothetical protein M23134_06363 [Microscilla marina ATCC 23134]
MKKIFILISILFFYTYQTQALESSRQKRVDSLENVVKNASHDSSRIKALLHLVHENADSLDIALEHSLQH